MKKMSLCLILLLLACMTFADTTQDSPMMPGFALGETDIDGLKITESRPEGWGYDLDKNNNILRNPGLYQEAMLGKIRFWIKYTEFQSVKQAEQAIDFYVHDVASIFVKGIWHDTSLQNIDAQTWYNEEGSSCGLLVLVNTTCFLISYHDRNVEKRKKVCEQIALKIIEKIKQGEHVIMPEEKPAPPAKGNGTTK